MRLCRPRGSHVGSCSSSYLGPYRHLGSEAGSFTCRGSFALGRAFAVSVRLTRGFRGGIAFAGHWRRAATSECHIDDLVANGRPNGAGGFGIGERPVQRAAAGVSRERHKAG
jgi:hypothetical protein